MIAAKIEIVMDTNVARVANGKTEQAGPACVLECVMALRRIQDEHCVLLDDSNLIYNEYRRRLSYSGQPGPGDAFFKWLHDNQGHPDHCRKVTVTLDPDREFEEFPNDPDLASFDRSDRKFVAVVLASETGPEVLNASDTDWRDYSTELQRHGVAVVFLCPELMNR